MTDDSAQPNRGGRPKGSATGQKKLRTLRMGPIWDLSQQLANEMAVLDGKAKGNLTAYVEEALREHNAKVERQLPRLRQRADLVAQYGTCPACGATKGEFPSAACSDPDGWHDRTYPER